VGVAGAADGCSVGRRALRLLRDRDWDKGVACGDGGWSARVRRWRWLGWSARVRRWWWLVRPGPPVTVVDPPGSAGDGGRSATDGVRGWPLCRRFVGVSRRRIDHRLRVDVNVGRSATGLRW